MSAQMTQQEMLEAQKAQCPFCQIIAKKIPAKVIYEDNLLIGILDINPASKGHTLLMPKEHYPIMPLIPPEMFQHLFSKVPTIAQHIKEASVSLGTTTFIANGAAAGQQSGHFMIHIVPREPKDHLENFNTIQKEVTLQNKDQLSQVLKQNLTKILSTQMPRQPQSPIENQQTSQPIREAESIEQLPHFTKAQVIDTIEHNPTFKKLIESNPEELKRLISIDQKLQTFFSQVSLDEIIDYFQVNQHEPIVIQEKTSPHHNTDDIEGKEKQQQKIDFNKIGDMFK